MCADCHSTNLVRGFDDQTATYHTTFSEIDVSCEACHGPGSLHVKLASRLSPFWDHDRGYGLAKLKGDDPNTQIETCAACHSRRRVIADAQTAGPAAGEPYCDHFLNETLTAATYHSDGQILDEVYVYGSFIQSKMFHKGIRCTDCHDPHTAKLKHEGNNVCTSCHQHPAGKYDSPAHHHHQPGTPGASCVECHMPEVTYMEVDSRRDHSIRIPRPDLSVELGTPNACVRCHIDPVTPGPPVSNDVTDGDDKKMDRASLPARKQYNDHVIAAKRGDAQTAAILSTVDRWAAEACQRWYGDTKRLADDRRYAATLEQAWAERDPSRVATFGSEGQTANRNGTSDSRQLKPLTLLDVATDRRFSAMIRASAVAAQPPTTTQAERDSTLKLLEDSDPLVRATAIASLEPVLAGLDRELAPEQVADVAELLYPVVIALAARLDDPRRAVRTEAARVLTQLPPPVRNRLLPPRQRTAYDRAFAELVDGFLVNNDRAGTHLTLGILYEARGERSAAEAAYRTAIRVEPRVVGPRSNLAALLESGGGKDAEATALRAAELPLLARDAALVPTSAMIAYRYGLALYLSGDGEAAETELARAVTLAPDDTQILLAYAYLLQHRGKMTDAATQARRLQELLPDDPMVRQLLNELAPPMNPSRGETLP